MLTPVGNRDYQEFRARWADQLGHSQCKALAEEDGELGFGTAEKPRLRGGCISARPRGRNNMTRIIPLTNRRHGPKTQRLGPQAPVRARS
jgi:hypothetical protein